MLLNVECPHQVERDPGDHAERAERDNGTKESIAVFIANCFYLGSFLFFLRVENLVVLKQYL